MVTVMKFFNVVLTLCLTLFAVSDVNAQFGKFLKDLEGLAKNIDQSGQSGGQPNYDQIKSIFTKYKMAGKWSASCFDADNLGNTRNFINVWDSGQVEIYQNRSLTATPITTGAKSLSDTTFIYFRDNYGAINPSANDRPVSKSEIVMEKFGANHLRIVSSKTISYADNSITEFVRDGKVLSTNANSPVMSNCSSDELVAKFNEKKDQENKGALDQQTVKVKKFLTTSEGKSFANACSPKISSELSVNKSNADLVCGCLALDEEKSFINNLRQAFSSARNFNEVKKFLGESDRLKLAFSYPACVGSIR